MNLPETSVYVGLNRKFYSVKASVIIFISAVFFTSAVKINRQIFQTKKLERNFF